MAEHRLGHARSRRPVYAAVFCDTTRTAFPPDARDACRPLVAAVSRCSTLWNPEFSGSCNATPMLAVNVLRAAFVSVDANEIGVKIVRGHVQGTLSPGWHLISPIGGKVKKFSTRIQQTSMLRNSNEGDRVGDDAVDVGDPNDPGARYGAGIEIYQADGIGTTLSHSGGWGGFETAFLVVPDRRLAVAATCTSPETVDQIGLTDDEQLLAPWIDGH